MLSWAPPFINRKNPVGTFSDLVLWGAVGILSMSLLHFGKDEAGLVLWIIRAMTVVICLGLWVFSRKSGARQDVLNISLLGFSYLYTAVVLFEVIHHDFSMLYLVYYLIVLLSISHAYAHPQTLFYYLFTGLVTLLCAIFLISQLPWFSRLGLAVSFFIAFAIAYQTSLLTYRLKQKHGINLAFMLEILGETADGMVVLNEKNQMVSANGRACELLEAATPEELSNESFMQFVDLKQLADLQKGQSREVFMQTKKGTPVFAEIAISPIQGEKRNFRLLRLTDISKYKLKEQQIRRSETTFKSVLESSHDWIWVINQDEQVIVSNHRFKFRNYQHTGQKLKDETPTRLLFNPNFLTKSQWQHFYQRCLSGELITYESVVSVEGEYQVFQLTFNPVKEGEEVIGASIFVKDITRQKKTQAILESVLQSSLSGIFVLNAVRNEIGQIKDFVLGMANEAAEAFFQQPIDSLTGKRLLEALPEVKPAGLFHQYKEVVESGLPLSIEHQLKSRSGDTHWLHTVAVKLGDGLAVSFADFTDRKEAELSLLAAKRQTEQEAKAKADFLATMSHEIRTPMNAVIGMADLLEETSLNEEQQEYVNIVGISGQNLLTVINDILDFSKIESGKLELERKSISPAQLVGEVFALLDLKAKEKELFLRSNLTEEMPKAILGDPTRLRQILINLINNALKFTSRGGVEVNLSAEPQQGKWKIQFEVRDTGIGIPQDKIGKLFQSYAQVDASTTRKYGGTGLGLLICKNLVELMQGSIWVDSLEGHGSSFYFTIMAEESQPETTQEIDLNQDPWEVIQDVPKSLRILIAEDNPINQKVALRILQKLGLNAKIAHHGKEALAMVQQEPFDLVFMDMQMPQMDGIEATERIRALPKQLTHHPRIIAMTANAMKGHRDRCLAAGMDDYITKPIQLIRVAMVLAKWFQVADRPLSS
ncbi:MAG: ATP-binding protein [Bacteroidota bacterium]